ncbi:MAG: MFS transporter [Gammaproteobacteria bacterium]|nr:MFS transporter [Gammaproteobacteria bacterium]
MGTLLGVRAGLEGFSATVIGLVMSAFSLGYIVGAYYCPRLIRDIGHIRSFAVLAAVASAAMILHGLLVHPVIWWILRIITGICIVGLYMVVESWLNSLIHSHANRGRIFSLYMMVTLGALGLGQFLLMLYGPMEMASFAIAALLFSLALVPIAVTRLPQPAEITVPELQLKKMFSISPLGSMGSFVMGIASGSFWGLGALYAHNLGFDEAGIALFVSLVVFGGMILQLPIGHWSDHRDRRKMLMLVSLLGAITALAIYLLAPHSHVALLVAATLFGGFTFSLYSLSVAHTNDHIGHEDVMEATRSMLLLNGVGAALGAIVGGLVMQWAGNEALMLYLAASLASLTLFALYRMRVGRPMDVDQQEAFVVVTRTGPDAVQMDPRASDEEELTDPGINR